MVFVEECSAKTGQLVNETFMALVETVYGVQMGLVEQGVITLDRLKLKDDDTSLEFGSRCCY